MKVLGDINVATAITAAGASVIISWIIARATTTRQTRAVRREEAGRSIKNLITPALGHVRLTLSACHGLNEQSIPTAIGAWAKYGGHDLLKELAKASDDLGPIRRWLVGRAARRVFGRSEYVLEMFYRWSSATHVFDAMIRAQFNALRATKQRRLRRRAVRPGLWPTAAEAPDRDLATLRTLERQLCRIYAVGGPLVASPRCVTYRERFSARWFRTIRWVRELRGSITPPDQPVPSAPSGRGAVVQAGDAGSTPVPGSATEESGTPT